MSSEKKLFIVQTISTFVHHFAVYAENEVAAADAVELDTAEEFAQRWLGQQIVSTEESTKEEYIRLFDREADYLKGWTEEQKMKCVCDLTEK